MIILICWKPAQAIKENLFIRYPKLETGSALPEIILPPIMNQPEEIQQKSEYDEIRGRIKDENELINQRLSWLGTFQGFYLLRLHLHGIKEILL